jgi:AcrR family transcriptional regulator
MSFPETDLTARARIRDAAIACVGERGVAGTTMRDIAARSGVSLGLVTHHFRNKQALVAACDRHIADMMQDRKRGAIQQGAQMDLLAGLRGNPQGPAQARYLARRLTDDSDDVAILVDHLVADAIAYTREAQAAGLVKSSRDIEAEVKVMLVWSLGALVLHQHVERLLGVDLTGDLGNAMAYIGPALDIFGNGVFSQELYERLRRQVDAAATGA